jgi:hypothetical protein
MKPLISIIHSIHGSWPIIAQEASNRVSRFCGPLSVISESFDPKDVIRARFTSLLKFDRPVWMMDADLWFVKPYTLPVISGDVIIGSLNEHAPADTVLGGKFKGLDFKTRDTFNLSLVSLDMGSEKIRQCVQMAIIYMDEHFGKDVPNHAEVFLNRSARELGIMVARMSNYLNWCGNQNISHKTIALHAAEQKNKLQWLREGVSKVYA